MKTVNDYITRYDGDIDIIIEGVMPDSSIVEQYYRGKLRNIPDNLRNVEVIEKILFLPDKMWILHVPRDFSLWGVMA